MYVYDIWCIQTLERKLRKKIFSNFQMKLTLRYHNIILIHNSGNIFILDSSPKQIDKKKSLWWIL